MKFLFLHIRIVLVSMLVPPLMYVGFFHVYLPSQEVPFVAVLSKSMSVSSISSTIFPTVILTPTSSPTLTPTKKLIPTISAISTPSPVLTKTPIPTAQPTHAAYTPNQLDAWFTQYSDTYKVDRYMLWKIAVCESGLNANARNGDYVGMYQFATRTWQSTRNHMRLDDNPDIRYVAEEAIKTAAFKISTSGTGAWANCSK